MIIRCPHCPDKLSRLIAATRSWDAARDVVRHPLAGDERDELAALAIEYLSIFPVLTGVCVVMSAGFSAWLKVRTSIPALVVVGSLTIGSTTYFHPHEPETLGRVFDETRTDFDGHAWVLAGDHIVDLSIFRTAYSGLGPVGLQAAVMTRFGEGQGVFISRPRTMRAEGFVYDAYYVLSDAQERAIATGADVIVDQFTLQGVA
jgi:hypothetical protein